MSREKELAELLIKYGGHKLWCTHREHNMFPCSCGWTRACDVASEVCFGNPVSNSHETAMECCSCGETKPISEIDDMGDCSDFVNWRIEHFGD
jgi:hypothetical protein